MARAVIPGEGGADTLAAGPLSSVDLTGPPRIPPRDRVITLLALNTSAFVFDFERAKLGEPALISPTVSNNISSDLLRGLTINMTHRLFDGTGADRKFSPSLQQIALSFSLRSGQSLGDLVGLGEGRVALLAIARKPSRSRASPMREVVFEGSTMWTRRTRSPRETAADRGISAFATP